MLDILKQASNGLLFISESDYPFETFLWKTEKQEKITPELIIQKAQHSLDTLVEFQDIDSLFEVATTEQSWHSPEEKETVKRYQNLSKVLKNNLTDIKVARLGRIKIDVYIFGKTVSGDLAGLATKIVET